MLCKGLLTWQKKKVRWNIGNKKWTTWNKPLDSSRVAISRFSYVFFYYIFMLRSQSSPAKSQSASAEKWLYPMPRTAMARSHLCYNERHHRSTSQFPVRLLSLLSNWHMYWIATSSNWIASKGHAHSCQGLGESQKTLLYNFLFALRGQNCVFKDFRMCILPLHDIVCIIFSHVELTLTLKVDFEWCLCTKWKGKIRLGDWPGKAALLLLMRSPQVHGEGLAFPQVVWDHGTVRFHEGPCPTSHRAPQSWRRKLCRAQTAGSWLSWLSWLSWWKVLLTAWKASSASGSWCISTWKLVSHIPRNVFHPSYDSSIYFQLDFSATRIPSEQMSPPLLVPSCVKYRAPSHPSPHQAALKTSEISNSFHACKLSKAQKRWNENESTIYKLLGDMCSLKITSTCHLSTALFSTSTEKNTKKTRTEKEDEAIGYHKHSASRKSFSARWLRSCMSVIELQPVNRTVLVMENTKNMTTRHQVTPWHPLQQWRNPHVVLWRGLLVFCSKQLGRRTECIAQTLRHHHAETHLCIKRCRRLGLRNLKPC